MTTKREENRLTPGAILEMRGEQTGDRRPAVKAIAAGASTQNLVVALERTANPDLKEILCDVLGNRSDTSSVPTLLRCLEDSSAGVRGSAADALGKLRSADAGPVLLSHFRSEPASGVRQLLALALGAVGYQPAVPFLIECLTSGSGVLRGCAAWSLGKLRVHEAQGPLSQALAKETDEYAINRMRAALEEITHKEADAVPE